MQSALLLLLGAYTASAQTFVDGSFWIRANGVVACDNTEGVIVSQSALLGLADTCLVEEEAEGVHSSYYNTTGEVTLHYANANCSGEAQDSVEWAPCSAFARDALTVSYSYATPSFRGDQIIWANYYTSTDCSGDSYQLGSGAPSTAVAGQCTAYLRRATDPIFATITDRISDSEIRVQYYNETESLCVGKAASVESYPINECVPAPTGSSFGSLKIQTNAPEIPPFLNGQVNLNEDASNLNKQVAGASIGVLCGFTALLICISMTGILG